MGERRCDQADRGRAALNADQNLGAGIEVLPDPLRHIGEARDILLRGVQYLRDGGSGIRIHAQHLGREGHLHIAHLRADQRGSD